MSTTRPAGSLTPARRIPIPGSRSSPADDDDSTGTPPTRRRGGRTGLLLLVGLAAVGFTAVYLISDLIEVAQGGFSTFRLSLTYAGEAAIPLFVIGLYAVQRPRIGRLGFFGAVAYAYSYVFFTSTVVYALIAGIPNYAALVKVFRRLDDRARADHARRRPGLWPGRRARRGAAALDRRVPDGRGGAGGGRVRAS
jgi:hypothetical protein